MIKKIEASDITADQKVRVSALKSFATLLVAALWLLPAWAVWQVMAHPEWQQGLDNWQVGVLAWYPLIAVLMLFFAVVLYRRLPKSWIGLGAYIIGTIGMAAWHWWLSGVASLTLLIIEWATFSLTLFVVGFSLELFRRILQMAIKGHWALVVFGGLANLLIFVIPGILIVVSLYKVLYQQEIFVGSLPAQIPYCLGLATAIWHDWRSFRSI